MRRTQVYLDNTTAEALANAAHENSVSTSNMAANILRQHFQNETQANPLSPAMKIYFLRIINTLNQVLQCVFDSDKITIKDASNAKECIDLITKTITTEVQKQNS